MYGTNGGYNLRGGNFQNVQQQQQQSPQHQQTQQGGGVYPNQYQDMLVNHQSSPTPIGIHHVYQNYQPQGVISPVHHQTVQHHQPQPQHHFNTGTQSYEPIFYNINQQQPQQQTQQQQDDSYLSDMQQEYYDDDGEWFEMRVEPEYPISNQQNTITTLRFDPWEELLWVGYQNGRVASLVNPNLERYSSFFASPEKSEIRDILVDSDGVLALSKSDLAFYTRGGAPIYNVHNDRMKDLNAVSYSKFDNSEIIVGNDHNIIFVIDFYTGKVVKEVYMPSAIKTINRSSGQIWVGLSSGDVSLLDQRTWRLEHTFQAHKGDVKSVDIQNDTLVSCGSSPRLGQLYVDPIIKVYDLKALRPLAPIQYKRPTLLKFHPKYYSTLAIVSDSTNQIYLHDLNQSQEQSQSQHIQVDSLFGYIYSFDISSTGEIMVIGDQGGLVHQWTDRDDVRVNASSFPTELVQFPQFQRPLKMNDQSALSEVPFKHQQPQQPQQQQQQSQDNNNSQTTVVVDQTLLSYWKPTLSYQVGLPQRPLNSALLAHLKQHDFVGYITNTGINRKQIRGKSYEEGKFKSLSANLSSMSHIIRPPKIFRWTELKFKKFGLEELDINEFNMTEFSGLENLLPNTYSNAVIQALYYIPSIRAIMLNHLCSKSYCISCELGFLFTMMDQSKTKIVDTSNFLRVLKQIPQATALGIILSPESPESQIPLPQLISNLYRFLIEQLHKEIGLPINKSQNNNNNNNSTNTSPLTTQLDSIFEKLFSSTSLSSNKCINCGSQYEKHLKQFQFELSYPSTPQEYGPDLSFSNILKNTLSKQIKSPAWCEKCQGFFSTSQKKSIRTLPPILCINANCIKKEHEEYWKFESTNIIPGNKTFISSTQPNINSNSSSTANQNNTNSSNEITWLPLKIRIKLDLQGNQVSVIEYPNNLEKSKVQINSQDLIEPVNESGELYELVCCISHIKDQFKRIPKQGHLVTQIKMVNGPSPDQKWYLFNDFKINECTPNDVTHFDPNWRTAAILYYSKVSERQSIPIAKFINPITKDTYLQNSLITCKQQSDISFIPATASTIPKKDDLIAIDTEFVSIGPEETEISLDGKRVIIQPGNFSLARVSMVRANAECFIDDYIQSIEPVTDYLTRFSGINTGDLDPTVSTKNVISLKNCYLKLRYLVDQGIKFVGHGLKKDFRIINMYVPPDQIIDTVELYQLKNQRKLSLRFLSFVLLKIDIQTETHCSVEDARTAMELYKYYLKLVSNNEFDETLKRIYDIGRQYNFKVPETDAALVQTNINNILSSPIPKKQINN